MIKLSIPYRINKYSVFAPHWIVVMLFVFPMVGCNESGIVEPEEMPEVIRTVPENQSEGVSANTSIVVSFNKKMNPSTISSSTFSLMQGETAVLGVLSTTDTTATLTPLGNLPGNATFTATVTTDVEDMSGNGMVENYSWSFRTAAADEDSVEEEGDDVPDNIPPTVQSTSPDDHEVEVPLNAVISASFSKEINPASLNNNTFTLRNGTNQISGSIEYEENNRVTFSPSSELPPGNTFTATITTDVEDATGNSLEEDHQWSFTTVENIDETPPEIVETTPADDTDDVDQDVNITITFNEEMDPSTIDESTFQLEWGWWGRGREVSGTIEYEGNTATFIPDERLADNRIYTAIISSDVENAAGIPLGESYEWNFRTEENDDDNNDEDDDDD